MEQKLIYGIFDGYGDERKIHSFYSTEKLAEKALKILTAKHEVHHGYVEEDRFPFIEKEENLPEIPETFVIYGKYSLYGSSGWYQTDGSYTYYKYFKNKVISLENPLIIIPFSHEEYVFAYMFSKDDVEDYQQIAKSKVEETIKNNRIKLGSLVSNSKIILNPHFIPLKADELKIQTVLRLFLTYIDEEDLLIKSTFYNLLDKFDELMQFKFREILNKHYCLPADSLNLQQIKNEILNTINKLPEKLILHENFKNFG